MSEIKLSSKSYEQKNKLSSKILNDFFLYSNEYHDDGKIQFSRSMRYTTY